MKNSEYLDAYTQMDGLEYGEETDPLYVGVAISGYHKTIKRALLIADKLMQETSDEMFDACFSANEKMYSEEPLDDVVEKTRAVIMEVREQLLKEL